MIVSIFPTEAGLFDGVLDFGFTLSFGSTSGTTAGVRFFFFFLFFFLPFAFIERLDKGSPSTLIFLLCLASSTSSEPALFFVLEIETGQSLSPVKVELGPGVA
jgi:hypothetical protein